MSVYIAKACVSQLLGFEAWIWVMIVSVPDLAYFFLPLLHFMHLLLAQIMLFLLITGDRVGSLAPTASTDNVSSFF